MKMEERVQIRDLDVYAVSDSGDEELKRGSTELSHAALELLVLIDGKSSIAEIAQRTKALSPEEIRRATQMLAQEGYIKPATLEQELNIDFSYFFADQPRRTLRRGCGTGARRGRSGTKCAQAGWLLREHRTQIGEQDRAGERGRLFGAGGGGRSGSAALAQVPADDGKVRASGGIQSQPKSWRRCGPPLPDVVLLDIGLPDTNGFEVLARMRRIRS